MATEASWAAYRVFLHRRVTRLAPVVLAVAVVGGPALVVLGGFPATTVARDSALLVTQTVAFALAAGTAVVAPLEPAWSLSVEWSFYLVFPLCLLVLRRRGHDPRSVTKVLALLALSLYLLGLLLPFEDFYLLPVANLGVLFAGAALASRHYEHRLAGTHPQVDPARRVMATVLLVALVFAPGDTLSWGWKLAVVPGTTAAALVVIHASSDSRAIGRLFPARWLGFVGLRAYSLYLWHLPVMWIVWVSLPATSPFLRAAIAICALVPVVIVSFELLERPVLRRRGTSQARRRALRAGRADVPTG